jgi:hypothetical protein
MAPPTVGHDYGLAAVAQTAVGWGFVGGFQLLTVVVGQGEVAQQGILPDSGLGREPIASDKATCRLYRIWSDV